MKKANNTGESSLKKYLTTFKLVSSGYPSFGIHLFFILLLFLLVAAVAAYTPFLLRQAANEIGKEQKIGFYLYASAYAFCWTLASILQNIKGIFSAGVLARSDAALHKILMRYVFSYPYTSQRLVDPGVVAQDIARAATSFSAITTAVFWTITPIFFEFIVAMVIINRTIGGTFAVLFGSCIFLLAIISYFVAVRNGDVHLRIYEAQNKVQSFVVERLGALFDIRVNKALSKEEKSLDIHLNNAAQAIWLSNLRMGLYLGCQALAIGLALGLFTAYSINLNSSARFTNGDFVMIAGYVGMLTMQLRFLSGAFIELKRHQVALALGVTYIPSSNLSLQKKMRAGIFKPNNDKIVFALRDISVTFADRLLFSNLSYDFHKNRFVAISAPSGFGKTTLINSMLGLLPVCNGRIEFYGATINNDSTPDVLQKVSIAPQATHVFNNSLRFNLTYGCDETPSDSKLLELLGALGYSGSFDGKMHPINLDERLGVGGRFLSGGERQRLSIGRAILRNKEVLILDEPTAFLNKELAKKIIQYAARSVPTLIVITHDEDVVAMADEVLSLAPYATQGSSSDLARAVETSRDVLSA